MRSTDIATILYLSFVLATILGCVVACILELGEGRRQHAKGRPQL